MPQYISFDEAAVLTLQGSGSRRARRRLYPAGPRRSPQVQVVEMRYFGGLSMEETAEVLNVSPKTVMRDWSAARIWLYRELTEGTGDGLGALEASR